MAVPIVPLSTLILPFSLDNKTLPAPVQVNVEYLGLGAPYSVGFLNCFSAPVLCELTAHIQFLICLLDNINTI
jgi:hypothetical protein